MPSEEPDVRRRNVELVRRLLEVGGREGPKGLLPEFESFFDPDVEWTPQMVGFGERTYRGRDGYAEYVREVGETVGEVGFSEAEIEAVGDETVLALGRLRAVGRESGLALQDEYSIVYRLHGGRIVSARAFLSHAEGEEAARG